MLLAVVWKCFWKLLWSFDSWKQQHLKPPRVLKAFCDVGRNFYCGNWITKHFIEFIDEVKLSHNVNIIQAASWECDEWIKWCCRTFFFRVLNIFLSFWSTSIYEFKSRNTLNYDKLFLFTFIEYQRLRSCSTNICMRAELKKYLPHKFEFESDVLIGRDEKSMI